MQKFIVPHTSSDAFHSWSQVADYILQHIPRGVLLLEGLLGVGKTTLVQHIAFKKGLTKIIASPTYSLIHVYSEVKLVHGDLYRLTHSRELGALGLDEFSDYLVVLEWGAAFQQSIDNCVAVVEIKIAEPIGDRLVTIDFL